MCWLDADVRNFRPHFVTRLLEPLLVDPDVGLVKGYYRRPLHGEPTGGGRVTELMARPLLSALFPQLPASCSRCAGEYGGRREMLEAVPFVEGWGVEIGLLIDVARTVRRRRDRAVRPRRARAPQPPARRALAAGDGGPRHLLATRRDRREHLGTTLIRFGTDHTRVDVEVDVSERPPMVTVPAYRAKFGRELSA